MSELLTIVFIVLTLGGLAAIAIIVTRIQAHARTDAWTEQRRALAQAQAYERELDPRYQAKLKEDRQHELATRELRLKEFQAFSQLSISQYGGLVPPGIAASWVQVAPVHKPLQIGKPEQAPAPGAAIIPARYDLREIWREFTPSKEQIFLGRSTEGNIFVPAHKLLHCALTGPTGGGKTSILRMILMQLIYIGAQVTLCDVHYAPIKTSETGEPIDWRPIVKRLAQEPIRDIATIAGWMNWLAFTELQARIDKQYAGQPIGKPIFFTIEELPAVLDEAREEIGRPLAKILRQGRQYGIFFIGASQDLLTNTLKMSSGPRECFRTGYYTGGDPTTARALLDLKQGERVEEEGLGQNGQVYLKTAIHQAVLTRVGWASNEALYDLFNVPASERLDTVVDADMPEIRQETARNGNVWTSVKTGESEPVDTTQTTSDERLKEYQLSDVEITAFIAAYKACGSIDRALASISKGSSYRDHARDLVRLHALRKEA